ncbi:hypothetical protein C4D60_Mb05t22080 [Musa balbisiana]|uniref:Uncharacterized protein n=1 Tax=Musa balbisiana TaxID=52838 RepID=A0A4S8JXY7_MUSBA|nr:hypothetical protein C4D60_Mb05t22080 [Musa balbisiana]
MSRGENAIALRDIVVILKRPQKFLDHHRVHIMQLLKGFNPHKKKKTKKKRKKKKKLRMEKTKRETETSRPRGWKKKMKKSDRRMKD